ncbi:p53 [Drosophila busckii]|uniref:p53 n=1 Tax=Drosophila busckii TaxID=30019 RepID=A0A0M3QXK1_DROBS|nr:cellular tumor antigen p53 [Drosophila busckii]ALC46073.1 p53 [Drosophila busckii]
MFVDPAMSSKKESSSSGNEEDPQQANTEEMVNEPLAYLQGLNSGNLMQFSQQSLLRDMMLQDMKTKVNILPKLEDHNNGGYYFSMQLEEPHKSHWMLSLPLNKMYIRMNKTFNIEVTFKFKMPLQQLNLRAFLCFVKDVSGPLLRCQNHLSTDAATDKKMRESLLRCENPNTMYCGTATGKSIAERYSVLVPLNMCRPGIQNGELVRQTLAFSFSCQNSCFGRKETCLVFCLENMNGDILGQQVIYVKICTCPKRDRNLDERQTDAKRRKTIKSDDEENENSTNKRRSPRRPQAVIKEDHLSNDSVDSKFVPADFELSRSPNGCYVLNIQSFSSDLLVDVVDGIIGKTAVALLENTDNQNLHKYYMHLQDVKRKLLN